MSANRERISRMGYIFAGQISNTLFGLIAAMCLTRFLDVGEYGRYSYVLQMLAFFAFLALPGMVTAVMQGAAQGFDGVLASGTARRLQFALLGTAGLLGIVLWRWHTLEPEMRVVLSAAAFAFPAYVCLSTYLYYLNGKRKYKEFALFCFFQTGGICAAAVTVAFLTRSFVWTAAAAVAAKILLDGIAYRIVLRKEVPAGAADDPEAFRIGWHLSMVSVISCFGNNFDKVIIGTWISYETLALYTIADMIAGQVKMLNYVMDAYIGPVIVNEMEEAAHARVLGRSIMFVTAAAVLSLAGYWAVQLLIHVFFTAKYVHSLPLVAGLLAINMLTSFGAVLSTHFRARKRIMEPYIIKIMESAGFLLALACFVPMWGIWGVVAALGVGNALYSLTGIVLFCKPGIADSFERSAVGRFIAWSVPGRKAKEEA